MGKLINKLEKKYGKYALEGLPLYLVLAYVIGYILLVSGSLDFIELDPYEIMQGQIWRIITWVIVPPQRLSTFTIFMLLLYYSLGRMLERTWGAFKYNLYIFSGMLFTIIGAMAVYVIGVYAFGIPAVNIGKFVAYSVSTYYINMSIFLACAVVYPDTQLYFYFLIPIKIKWLGILYGIMTVWDMVQGGIFTAVVIAMSLLNFVCFYLLTKSHSGGYRNAKWTNGFTYNSTESEKKSSVASASGTKNESTTKHKCTICGQTELDNDELEFRYCSKCNGNYEYCNVHLFTHKHRI